MYELLDLDLTFEEYGIEYNAKSGGNFKPIDFDSFHKNKLGMFEVNTLKSDKIIFLNHTLFLKTLQKTEQSLNIKLFV